MALGMIKYGRAFNTRGISFTALTFSREHRHDKQESADCLERKEKNNGVLKAD
jgi:hypothetical protein